MSQRSAETAFEYRRYRGFWFDFGSQSFRWRRSASTIRSSSWIFDMEQRLTARLCECKTAVQIIWLRWQPQAAYQGAARDRCRN